MSRVTVRELAGPAIPQQVLRSYVSAAPPVTLSFTQRRDVLPEIKGLLTGSGFLDEVETERLLSLRRNNGQLLVDIKPGTDGIVGAVEALDGYDSLIETFNLIKNSGSKDQLLASLVGIMESPEDYPWCVPDAATVKQESDFRYGVKTKEVEGGGYRGKCKALGCNSKRFSVVHPHTQRADEYQPSRITCLECGKAFTM